MFSSRNLYTSPWESDQEMRYTQASNIQILDRGKWSQSQKRNESQEEIPLRRNRQNSSVNAKQEDPMSPSL